MADALNSLADELNSLASKLDRVAFELNRLAFELNPDSSLAHNLYTYAEVDSGRALQAVLRLLGRLKQRSSDPELYAGLVHACRYIGVLDASVAAYQRAIRLVGQDL